MRTEMAYQFEGWDGRTGLITNHKRVNDPSSEEKRAREGEGEGGRRRGTKQRKDGQACPHIHAAIGIPPSHSADSGLRHVSESERETF